MLRTEASTTLKLMLIAIGGVLGFGASIGSAQEVPSSAPANANAVLQILDEGGIEGALDELGKCVDRGITVDDIFDSELPTAAGGIFRFMNQLSADEQYDRLLRWTLPTAARRSVRILSTPVPVSAPSKEFAQAIGQRPRDTTFAVAEVGGVAGLYCSGWMLAKAADELGSLTQLIVDLEKLSAEKIPGAKHMLLLAQVADRRSDGKDVQAYLTKIEMGDGAEGEAASLHANELITVAIAAAALTKDKLRLQSEAALQRYANRESRLRPFMRIVHATAVQICRGRSPASVLYESQLRYWTPVTGRTALQHRQGLPHAMWLTHEDHVLHLAGGSHDVLYCRYPLTGEFEFTCEAQEGGRIGTNGGLVYGGLFFEALGSTNELTVWDADGNHPVRRHRPFVRHESEATFNRVSIQSATDSIAFESNFHPIWRDDVGAKTSPWLGLRSHGTNRPVFRNLRIEGKPLIPREVRLINGDQLRGWESGYFGERQHPFLPAPSEAVVNAPPAPDWQVKSGILTARKGEVQAEAASPGLLRYQRPLLERESIAYEFEHQTGEAVIHPAIGRLVFLLQPSGVRVRWLTDGRWDWTGLPDDNAILEPMSRRGPRSLPLKEGDWNRVVVSRLDDKLTVTLNDHLIYHRALNFGGSQQFGLYRQTRGSSVRIRNVVMTGDWPEQLPEDFLNNPVALVDDHAALDDRNVLCATVGEETIASNVHAVRRKVLATDAEHRYDELCRWVLPGDDHRSVRMTGLFVPTHASPLALVDQAFKRMVEVSSERSHATVRMNGDVMSPVYDLLDIAAETGKLGDLRSRIESIDDAASEYQKRAKAALVSLLELEDGSDQTADRSLLSLLELVENSTTSTTQDVWLELLVANRYLHQAPGRRVTGDFISSLYSKRVKITGDTVDTALRNHLLQITSQLWVQQRPESKIAVDDMDLPPEWLAASESNAATCGTGRATAQWARNRLGEVTHLAGHDVDYLYFQSPLRGAYTIEADIAATGALEVLHGNEFCSPGSHSLDTIQIGSFHQPKHSLQLDKPFDKLQRWVRYRVDVTDEASQVFLNGRMVRRHVRSPDDEPWFAFRGWWNSRGDFRDVSITGSPTVPDEVALSNSPELAGWLSYHRVGVATDDGHWQWVADENNRGRGIISGRRRADLRGSACERLLQYHRPLFEDGDLEFEFFYEPDEVLAAPALGRLALVFRPDGVYEHWVTDGKHDSTLVRPDNLLRDQSSQRGEANVPLIPGAWNQVRLELHGTKLLMRLNNKDVFERVLPAGLEKRFGIFHFADLHEARVRRVTMRGEWPQEISGDQPLADPGLASLDAGLPKLSSVFRHVFANHEETERYVNIAGPRAGVSIADRPTGKQVSVASQGNWSQTTLSPRFSIQGDFDVEARFSSLSSDQPSKEGSANLGIRLSDEFSSRLVTTIGKHAQYGHFVRGQVTLTHPDGTPNYISTRTTDESNEGRLRIARRGEKIYFLFAQGSSPRYRLIGEHSASTQDVEIDAIQLLTVANGVGQTSVIWNDITLRAEKMKFVPSPKIVTPPTLAVMNLDTGQLREIASPIDGYTHLGSPEWSPDGKMIAYDQSTGSTTRSRVMIVNVDGGVPIDVGYGSMPTFSADGKQVAFSAAGEGVGTMNADGSKRRIVDRAGWGIQWSPDGKRLAYSTGGQIILWDVATESRRALMSGPLATRYDYLYWNMSWSRDSSRIVFKGRRGDTGQDEVAVVSLQQPDRVTVLVGSSLNTSPDFSWSPNSDSLLLSMAAAGTRGPQLFIVRADGSKPPELLEKQPENRTNVCGVWSPDGRSIAVTGIPRPVPVDWPATKEEDAESEFGE